MTLITQCLCLRGEVHHWWEHRGSPWSYWRGSACGSHQTLPQQIKGHFVFPQHCQPLVHLLLWQHGVFSTVVHFFTSFFFLQHLLCVLMHPSVVLSTSGFKLICYWNQIRFKPDSELSCIFSGKCSYVVLAMFLLMLQCYRWHKRVLKGVSSRSNQTCQTYWEDGTSLS